MSKKPALPFSRLSPRTGFPHASSAYSASSSSFLFGHRSGSSEEVRKAGATNLPGEAGRGGASGGGRDAPARGAGSPAGSPPPAHARSRPALTSRRHRPGRRPRSERAAAAVPTAGDPPTGRRGAPRPQRPPLRPPRPDKEKRRRGRRRSPGLRERRAARAPRRRGAGGADSGRAASGPAREGGAGRRGAHPLPASPRRTRRDPSPAAVPGSRSALCRPRGRRARAVPLRLRRWDSWCTRSPKMTCGKVCGKGRRFFLEPGLFLCCLISTKCA